MILQKLIDYSRTLDMPPAMYGLVPVKYVINLNLNGNYISTDILDGGRKSNDRGKELLAPTIVRSSGINPKLLVDNGEYLLGITRENSNAERVKNCHNQFIQLINDCAKKTKNTALESILKFYTTVDYQSLRIADNFDPSMNITFRVNGDFPFNTYSVKEFWKNYTSAKTEADASIKCHICRSNPAEERMPAKVKRIPGGQSAGTALISANSSAFESFGLKSSKVGPTCRDCAEKFTFALNHLLSNDNSHLTIGKQVYVFWSKGEDFSPVKVLRAPEDFFSGLPALGRADDPAKVKLMFKSAFSGKTGAIDDHEQAFFAAAFSAAGGRVVIRDWLETTIPAAKQNLVDFFANCYHKYQQHPHGIYSLASATVRDVNKELPARILIQLLNIALKGTRLPEDLLYQAVKRAKAEQGVTSPRAALIKLFFISNKRQKEINMTQLDTKTNKPAYLCGRLLATLEEIQSAALGNTNTTIVDRYYGTASTAPATVFSVLMTGARHHLGKLRKEKPGYHTNLEKKLQSIVSGLAEFPKVLTLEEQGLFALGYYHQKQERFQSKEKKEVE